MKSQIVRRRSAGVNLMRTGMARQMWPLVTLFALMPIACGGVIQAANPMAVNIAGDPPAVPVAAPPPVLTAVVRKHVEIVADHVVIDEKVQFENGKAAIKPESNSLLDELAKVIKGATFLKKLEVQGHASAEGDAVANTKLSDERAKSVMAALVTRGVSAQVLSAKGYGSSKPLADNTSEVGREKNRRVEFLILDPAVRK
jgi:outer membrane protein OmpA-like peptidoglycan-associated protein